MSSSLENYKILGQDIADFKERVLTYLDPLEAEREVEDFYDKEEVKVFLNYLENFPKNERIFVLGDYDCDGISSLSIILRLLDHLKIKANYLIPSRLKDGYGLKEKHVELALKHGFKAMIVLDSGIIAHKALKLAFDKGLDVLVIDHHEFSDLPIAKAIIHPALLKDYYEGMCTAGLCLLLAEHFYDDDYSKMLGMLGSIGDSVKMQRANRKIVIKGIDAFNKTLDTPLHALIKKSKHYTYEDISFKLIPVINAISRMEPLANVNYLVAYLRKEKADLLVAKDICDINTRRKEESEKMVNRSLVYEVGEGIALFYDPSFKEGLSGLVASRLAQKYERPVLVLADHDNELKGSGRSFNDFDLYNSLKDFDAFLEYGGHQKAVGFSLLKKDLKKFKDYVTKLSYVHKPLKKELIYLNHRDLNIENLMWFESLKPFGEGFKEPAFFLEYPAIESSFLIKKRYPKYKLLDGIEAMGFNSEEFSPLPYAFIGHLGLNYFTTKPKVSFSIDKILKNP